MNITPFQHKIIQRVFPNYNQSKSSIIAEGGNEIDMAFIVHIYRKGKFRFEVEGGEYRSHIKIG